MPSSLKAALKLVASGDQLQGTPGPRWAGSAQAGRGQTLRSVSAPFEPDGGFADVARLWFSPGALAPSGALSGAPSPPEDEL